MFYSLLKNIMNLDQAIEEIKLLSDPRAVKVWARCGMDASNFLGANLTKLKALSKKIKKNHELALDLWETGIHDAKLLATMIEDPKKTTETQVDKWVEELEFWDLADKSSRNVFAKTSFAKKKMDKWIDSDNRLIRRAGFMILYEFAATKMKFEYDKYLPLVEQGLYNEHDMVRESANYVLIVCGLKVPGMKEQCLAIAKKAGKIIVDYGQSSCKVPDAVAMLSKV